MHVAEQFELLEVPEGRWAKAWRETRAEWDEYMEDARTEGGLVPKAVAARMLGVSPQAITDRLKRGTLTPFEHFDMEFLSLREIRKSLLNPTPRGRPKGLDK